MYLDYLNDLKAHYQGGKRNATLPQRLMRPTPASIRDECRVACKTRFHHKDFRVLTAFFEAEWDQEKMLRAIDRCDLDRFRPLVNFLRGNINRPDDLNIEILAWLMDFTPRPYTDKYRKISPERIAGEIQNETTTQQIQVDNDIKKDLGKTSFVAKAGIYIKQYRNKFAAAALLLCILSAIILINKQKLFGADSSLSQKSMVLAGNTDLPPETSVIPITNKATLIYARCTGSSPCKACSNCGYCNWCNSGGTCGICASSSKKKTMQKRILQCQAITKKGTQCSRGVKNGSSYCWQHLR